jgi:hypothetical protein
VQAMNPGSKIGVLTFHRCINYGSYWQARSLVEGLRAMGHEAVLLDHHSAMVDRREWRCALEPQLPSRSPAGDRPRYAAKARRFFEALDALPQSPQFDLDNPLALGEWDVVIVGSDEVWNLRHPWYGGHAAFYGAGIKTRRLVSYAASFGNQPAADGLTPFWTEALSNFALISVRDANSARIVREALGEEPEMVLDPCLQFPPTVDAAERSPVERPYLAVYGHSFPGWFSDSVRSCANGAGCPLLSIGYRNDWADEQLLDVGPLCFAALIAGAEAVATNFFHGCVFALLNQKPFACVSSDYRANKLAGLMRLLSAEKHILVEGSGPSSVRSLFGTPPNLKIQRRIDTLRQRSQSFIERAVAV